MKTKKLLLWILVFITLVYSASAINLTSNMVHYYTFDTANSSAGGGNPTMTDWFKTANVTSSVNTPTWNQTGQNLEAWDYEYSNSEYSVLKSNNAFSTNINTVCAWINMDNGCPDANYCSVWGGDDSRTALMLRVTSTEYTGFFYRSNGGNGICNDDTTQLDSGSWHHICFVYDSADAGNEMKIYVNGTNVKTCADVGALNFPVSVNIIGVWRDLNYPFDGLIDELMFYSDAKNSTFIQKLYNETNAGNYAWIKGGGGPAKSITVSYSSPVYEESLTQHKITFKNYNLTNTSTANLIWSGTKYIGTGNYINANNMSFTYNLTVPYVSTNNTPINFSWNYTIQYTTGSNSSGNTINYTQNIVFNDYPSIFYIRDIATNTLLSGWNITLNGTGGNYFITNSSSINITKGTYNYTAQKSDYQTKNGTITLWHPSNTNTIYLTPYYYFNLKNEPDGTPFNTSIPDEVKLSIFCSNTTINHVFNTSNAAIPINCTFSYLKMNVNYNTSSYFRTLIPTGINVDWYLVDATTYTVLQTLLTINDLTNDYNNGKIKLERVVGTDGLVTIIEQFFDVEDKAILYLMQSESYTVSVINNQEQERTLGLLISETAGEKTITYPPINFIPTETRYEDDISWSVTDNFIGGWVRFQYQDDTGGTTQVQFNVYNGTNTSQLLFASSSGTSNWTSTFNSIQQNHTYLCEINITHSIFNDIYEQVIISDSPEIISDAVLEGWTGQEAQDIKKWIGFIFLMTLGLVFGALESYYGIVIVMIFAYLLTLLSVGVWSLTLLAALSVIAFFEWWRRSKER